MSTVGTQETRSQSVEFPTATPEPPVKPVETGYHATDKPPASKWLERISPRAETVWEDD